MGKMLVVEDDANQMNSIMAVVPYGIVVDKAVTYTEFLAKQVSKYDLVLTDIRLDENDSSNMDGLKILQYCRKHHPRIPVAVMTAYGDKALEREVKFAGAVDFLAKPFNLSEFDHLINKYIISKNLIRKQRIKEQVINLFPPILFFCCFILIWHVIVSVFHVKEYILPSPVSIFNNILAKYAILFYHTGITLIESVVGFIIANIIGVIFAVLFVHSKFLEKSVFPYIIALKAIPIVAIAPLLILWFGFNLFGKVVMSALICFFPIVVNTTVGLKAVDEDEINLMKSLSASKMQILLKLRFPKALPYIFSALKISSTMSVIGAIVAELSGANTGLGYLILIATYQIETAQLFSAIIFASLASIAFFYLILFIEKKVIKIKEVKTL